MEHPSPIDRMGLGRVLRIGLLLVLGMGIGLPLPGGVAGESIPLAAQAEVRGSVVRLADLVADHGPERLPTALGDVELGPAPLPGGQRVLDGDHIRARVRQAGFSPERIELAAADRATVTRSNQTISRETMAGWVRHYLEDRLQASDSRAEIGEIRIGQDLILPAGTVSHRIVPPKNQALSGKVPLALHCLVDGREQKMVWAVVKIVRQAQVVVARKPLRRHKLINADDIKLETMDLAQLPSGVITDPDEVLGQRTQRKIDPNTVLRSDLVELPPLVKRRDVVVIVAEAPGFSITTLGEAQENGRLGERIRVTNLDSKQRIFARVVDATTVQVDF